LITTATTAQPVHTLWAELLNHGDVKGLLTLFEGKASIIAGPQTVITGESAIREALQRFRTLPPTVTRTLLLVAPGPGGLALGIARWTLEGTAPKGNPVTMIGQTSHVLRRQSDGSWKFAIDNLFGEAAAGS
jgi:ketosteroid isomerase-like protein